MILVCCNYQGHLALLKSLRWEPKIVDWCVCRHASFSNPVHFLKTPSISVFKWWLGLLLTTVIVIFVRSLFFCFFLFFRLHVACIWPLILSLSSLANRWSLGRTRANSIKPRGYGETAKWVTILMSGSALIYSLLWLSTLAFWSHFLNKVVLTFSCSCFRTLLCLVLLCILLIVLLFDLLV